MNSGRAVAFAIVLVAATCARAPVVATPPASVWRPSAPPAALPVPARPAPVLLERVVPSGLRVVVLRATRRPLVSLRLVFPHGSTSEAANEAGLVHLATALLAERMEPEFAETEAASMTPRARFGLMGATLDYRAAHDAAGLSVDGFARDVERYFDELDAVLRASEYAPERFQAWIDHVYSEIEDREVHDSKAIADLLLQVAFGAKHPYGRRVVGRRSTLRNMDEARVQKTQEWLVRADGATLLVVGDVEPEVVFRRASALFGARPSKRTRARPPLPPVVAAPRESVAVVARTPSAAPLLCASRVVPLDAGSEAALAVLAKAFERGPLRAALREETGLAYHASATVARRRAARALLVCTQPVAARLGEAVTVLHKTLESSRRVEPAEVDEAKRMLVSEAELAMDDVRRATETLLEEVALEHDLRLEPRVRALGSVTVEEVQRLADALLTPGSFHYLLAGDPAAATAAVTAAGLGATKVVTRTLD